MENKQQIFIEYSKYNNENSETSENNINNRTFSETSPTFVAQNGGDIYSATSTDVNNLNNEELSATSTDVFIQDSKFKSLLNNIESMTESTNAVDDSDTSEVNVEVNKTFSETSVHNYTERPTKVSNEISTKVSNEVVDNLNDTEIIETNVPLTLHLN